MSVASTVLVLGVDPDPSTSLVGEDYELLRSLMYL